MVAAGARLRPLPGPTRVAASGCEGAYRIVRQGAVDLHNGCAGEDARRMRRSTLRATRLAGSRQSEVDRGAALAGRRAVTYWCHAGHSTSPTFSDETEPPSEWQCPRCGQPAGQQQGAMGARPPAGGFHRTPYEFLMMRRTELEGERLLDEALADLRHRRGPGPGSERGRP